MKKILVSECLFGGRAVRYDAKEKTLKDPLFLKWKEEGRLIAFCPEVYGGLPVPRMEAQRVGDRVLGKDGEDLTEAFRAGAEEAVRIARTHDVSCCILKQNSPSCGSRYIYDGSFSNKKIPGMGLTAEILREAGFAIFDETELQSVSEHIAE